MHFYQSQVIEIISDSEALLLRIRDTNLSTVDPKKDAMIIFKGIRKHHDDLEKLYNNMASIYRLSDVQDAKIRWYLNAYGGLTKVSNSDIRKEYSRLQKFANRVYEIGQMISNYIDYNAPEAINVCTHIMDWVEKTHSLYLERAFTYLTINELCTAIFKCEDVDMLNSKYITEELKTLLTLES